MSRDGLSSMQPLSQVPKLKHTQTGKRNKRRQNWDQEGFSSSIGLEGIDFHVEVFSNLFPLMRSVSIHFAVINST